MTESKIHKHQRKPMFTRRHIIRLNRLLHMKYTPAEIANEIGVTVDTVYRSYLPAGCPSEMDQQGHVWIVGSEFREWVDSIRSQKTHRVKHPDCAKPNWGWCFHCSKCVEILNSQVRQVNYHLALLQGECEYCGGKVNRAIAVKKGDSQYDC